MILPKLISGGLGASTGGLISTSGCFGFDEKRLVMV